MSTVFMVMVAIVAIDVLIYFLDRNVRPKQVR
jgi:hypothetical protein